MPARPQLVTVVGLTHASSVIAVVKRRDAESGIVTTALVPLNESAPPYFPAVDHVVADTVPVLPLPDRSVTVVPVPSLNEYAATRPVCAPADAAPNPSTNTRPAAVRAALRKKSRCMRFINM